MKKLAIVLVIVTLMSTLALPAYAMGHGMGGGGMAGNWGTALE